MLLGVGIVVVGAALLMKRGDEPPSSGTGAAPTDKDGTAFVPQRPEFELSARTIFQNRGGILDRTGPGLLTRALESVGNDVNQRVGLLCQLTEAYLKAGEPGKAIKAYDEVKKLVGGNQELLRQNPDILRIGAVAQLRQAEVSNCVSRHNRDCCVFPLRDGGVHSEPTPAARAAQAYEA